MLPFAAVCLRGTGLDEELMSKNVYYTNLEGQKEAV